MFYVITVGVTSMTQKPSKLQESVRHPGGNAQKFGKQATDSFIMITLPHTRLYE